MVKQFFLKLKSVLSFPLTLFFFTFFGLLVLQDLAFFLFFSYFSSLLSECDCCQMAMHACIHHHSSIWPQNHKLVAQLFYYHYDLSHFFQKAADANPTKSTLYCIAAYCLMLTTYGMRHTVYEKPQTSEGVTNIKNKSNKLMSEHKY